MITAAVIPGKKSPVLVTEEMVKGMAPGSVILDLASERGGNCEISETGKTVVKHGVTIIGAINLASRCAVSRQHDVCAKSHFVSYLRCEGSEVEPESGRRDCARNSADQRRGNCAGAGAGVFQAARARQTRLMQHCDQGTLQEER